MTTLKDIAIGSSCTVVRLHGVGAIRRRLLDMGLTKGARIKVQKVAPLGDPIQITVRGYELTLRKDEAANVEVEAI